MKDLLGLLAWKMSGMVDGWMEDRWMEDRWMEDRWMEDRLEGRLLLGV